MFAKSDDLHADAGAGNFFQRLPKRLAIGGGHHQRRQPLLPPAFDVGQHVAVDVAVLVDLGLGEDREPHVT